MIGVLASPEPGFDLRYRSLVATALEDLHYTINQGDRALTVGVARRLPWFRDVRHEEGMQALRNVAAAINCIKKG